MSSSSQYNTQLASPPPEYEDMPSAIDISSYARSMHRHTQKQMDAAAKAARRRTSNNTNTHAPLDSESSVGSMDSRSGGSSISSTTS
ncbi:hypothetical protein LAWI1_G007225 [Lachnellula willkommii]|uniref:Uncharacterized protein n=1 Tax=Lachnellula willkommii TaxID=215461 RepID=A0A559M445_9HELO|nr:hypothetical protein LAWI1_G007225 [Lachnellula willkommii]